jgi:hypothetical protein
MPSIALGERRKPCLSGETLTAPPRTGTRGSGREERLGYGRRGTEGIPKASVGAFEPQHRGEAGMRLERILGRGKACIRTHRREPSKNLRLPSLA